MIEFLFKKNTETDKKFHRWKIFYNQIVVIVVVSLIFLNDLKYNNDDIISLNEKSKKHKQILKIYKSGLKNIPITRLNEIN